MKIAMMARNANLYSHKRIKEAAEARGHELDIINTLRCYMNIASHRPEIYYNDQKLPKYDAVIPRIGDLPPLNWSILNVSRRRTENGYETSQTRRDSLEAASS
jgi:glutathione synthase/RimK-type ligase-like ATP-grasp enzyme